MPRSWRADESEEAEEEELEVGGRGLVGARAERRIGDGMEEDCEDQAASRVRRVEIVGEGNATVYERWS